ncbi:MAG TPA: MFS transporter [Gemmataceae bacterium]|nr:MFS transporter [Gemmataceae bacterium]
MRPTNVRYVVLFGLCLAAGLAYIHRGCLSVVESTVRDDLGLSLRQMGWATGIFFWAYALFQIPTGLLADHWGPRRALTLFGLLGAVTVAMSAGTLWVDAATGFIILFLARVLMGIAQAGLFPASTRALSVWIPLRRRAVAAGILQACMSIGGALGAFATAQLLTQVYWPWIFLIYAVPGLIWSAWFFAWFRDRPDEHRGTNSEERTLLRPDPAAADGRTVGSAAILFSFPVICLCCQQFCRAGANVFWFTWCPTYLQKTHDLNPTAAGSLTSLPIVGVVFGSILGGIIADRILVATGSRRLSRAGTAVGACGVGVLLFGLTYLIPRDQAALAITALVLAATVVSCSNSCGYSAAMDLGGKNLATVFGAMNMFGNFGAALFSQILPEWVTWFGWPAAVLLVGAAYAIGLCWWLPLDPDPLKTSPEELDYADPPGR